MIPISTLHVLSLDVFIIVQSLGQGLKLTFHRNIGKKLMLQYLEVPNQDAGDVISPSCNSQNLIAMHCANFALNLMIRLKIPATGVDIIMEEAINLIRIAEVQHKDPNISVVEALSNFKTQKQRIYSCPEIVPTYLQKR